MKSLMEIVAYEKKFDSHFVGVKVLQGSEPESGMIYKDLITNTQWKVYGGGTLPIEAHKKGIRGITLIPIEKESQLKIGMVLEQVTEK